MNTGEVNKLFFLLEEIDKSLKTLIKNFNNASDTSNEYKTSFIDSYNKASKYKEYVGYFIPASMMPYIDENTESKDNDSCITSTPIPEFETDKHIKYDYE